MKILHYFVLIMVLSMNSFAGSVTATYSAGDIPTTYITSASVSTSSRAVAPGLLTVTIPAGNFITSVNVVYTMTATSLGYISEQRSFLRCTSTSGTDELTVSSGSGNSSGTYAYNRSNLTIANNVTGGGDIQFELHVFRTYGGTGSGSTYNYVDNNSWQITVNYEPAPDAPQNLVLTGYSNQIKLEWTKNAANNSVIVAANTTNTFGNPLNGSSYSLNNTLSGGGTIIYIGSLTTWSQSGLSSKTPQYYKLWSVSSFNNYSVGLSGSTSTGSNPVVSNVSFVNNIATTGLVDIYYDVADAEQSSVTILMEVSNDGGVTYSFPCVQVTGDIGSSITTGTNKHIIWEYDREHSGVLGSNFKIKIQADDLVGDQIYYSGQVYNVVFLGSQAWLKENLNVGTKVINTTNQLNNGVKEKYCFNNDEANCTTYGGLYQWAEAVQYQNGTDTYADPSPAFSGNVQGICPTGWHIPTDNEFIALANAIGGNSQSNSLKTVGQGTGIGAGTNTSGFSALLGGNKYYADDSFQNFPNYTWFWSTGGSGNSADYLRLDYNNSIITYGSFFKSMGFSVRCVKN
jgi:uncharacterized protein (TIGR02145 family)